MLSRDPHETADYLSHVMRKAPSIIYVFNQEIGQNEYANQNVAKVLGYSSEDVLRLGLDLMAENLHPDDRDRVFAHIAGLRELDDEESRTVEYRMRHRDGHWVWLLSTDSVFKRDEDGVVTHHIGSAVDITAFKEH